MRISAERIRFYPSLIELIEGLREHMLEGTCPSRNMLANNSINPGNLKNSTIGYFCTSCNTNFDICIKNLTDIDKKIICDNEKQASLPERIKNSEFFGL